MPRRTGKPVKGQKLNYPDLKREAARQLRRDPSKRYSAAQLLKTLKISNSRPEMQKALDQLVKEGRAIESASGIYIAGKSAVNKTYIGTVDLTRSGAAYIVIENKEKDIYVPGKFVGNAQAGDKVRVEVAPGRGRRNPDGKIISILQRARKTFMGKFFGNEKRGVVLPFKARDGFEITIFANDQNGAKEGDVVLVDVIEWPDQKQKLVKGIITEVLGAHLSDDLEMKSILINQGFDLHFSKAAMIESEQISSEITAAEIDRRRDMRGLTTFTIDPVNAKDFDDALSYEVLDNGHLEIGVHIADVTHYLHEGGELDKEAYERSTSVYLVDRVLPMLPEKLSNELCSLRPQEDKLCFSVVFEFDNNHKVVNTWIGKTVIHSDRRFTYEEAQQVLNTGTGEFAAELKLINRIAKKLAKDRFKHGAISFESDEVMFKLDDKGFPIELFVKERMDAHMLIEDFMLLANKAVAQYIRKKGQTGNIPFVYRVHDVPNEEKLADFAKFAAELGFRMDISNPKAITRSFNLLAEKVETDETLRVLSPLAIRTMAKAEYTTENIGHYGLGFEDYSHFTSPIRRYSDVLAHRILFRNLGDEVYRTDREKLEVKCKHISAQERKAMEAERESIKYKQVEYMSQFVGREFDGIISGIHERGLFVELIENLCEGMISFDKFGESFSLEVSKLKVVGNRSGRIFKMGDKLRVVVTDTDLEKRRIELEAAE